MLIKLTTKAGQTHYCNPNLVLSIEDVKNTDEPENPLAVCVITYINGECVEINGLVDNVAHDLNLGLTATVGSWDVTTTQGPPPDWNGR